MLFRGRSNRSIFDLISYAVSVCPGGQ